MAAPRHILDGFKVLDFTQYIAGPTATRLMAGMGAEIVKVEIAPAGDRSRELPLIKDGRSGYYIQQNIGKKSICVDIKQPAALALIKDLIPKVDVVVENFAPGVIARMGFDLAHVQALNTKLFIG